MFFLTSEISSGARGIRPLREPKYFLSINDCSVDAELYRYSFKVSWFKILVLLFLRHFLKMPHWVIPTNRANFSKSYRNMQDEIFFQEKREVRKENGFVLSSLYSSLNQRCIETRLLPRVMLTGTSGPQIKGKHSNKMYHKKSTGSSLGPVDSFLEVAKPWNYS